MPIIRCMARKYTSYFYSHWASLVTADAILHREADERKEIQSSIAHYQNS